MREITGPSHIPQASEPQGPQAAESKAPQVDQSSGNSPKTSRLGRMRAFFVRFIPQSKSKNNTSTKPQAKCKKFQERSATHKSKIRFSSKQKAKLIKENGNKELRELQESKDRNYDLAIKGKSTLSKNSAAKKCLEDNVVILSKLNTSQLKQVLARTEKDLSESSGNDFVRTKDKLNIEIKGLILEELSSRSEGAVIKLPPSSDIKDLNTRLGSFKQAVDERMNQIKSPTNEEKAEFPDRELTDFLADMEKSITVLIKERYDAPDESISLFLKHFSSEEEPTPEEALKIQEIFNNVPEEIETFRSIKFSRENKDGLMDAMSTYHSLHLELKEMSILMDAPLYADYLKPFNENPKGKEGIDGHLNSIRSNSATVDESKRAIKLMVKRQVTKLSKMLEDNKDTYGLSDQNIKEVKAYILSGSGNSDDSLSLQELLPNIKPEDLKIMLQNNIDLLAAGYSAGNS